jgi:TusA-related sulfurtransferase
MPGDDHKIKPVKKTKGFLPFNPVTPCKRLDYRNSSYPYKDLKTLLAQSNLQKAEYIEIWICGEQSASEVHSIVSEYGYNTEFIEQREDYYTLRITRKI